MSLSEFESYVEGLFANLTREIKILQAKVDILSHLSSIKTYYVGYNAFDTIEAAEEYIEDYDKNFAEKYAGATGCPPILEISIWPGDKVMVEKIRETYYI